MRRIYLTSLLLLSLGLAMLLPPTASAQPPRMVAIGAAEVVWNQTRDACPGKNWAGHAGEQPDSMPLAWHNPLTNETSLISANDWGTFATVSPSLGASAKGRHDCSHRVYRSVNSTDPASFANHQWMQSVQVFPNGSGVSLIHSEFHGGMVGNASICSTTGPAKCQYWSAGLGKTTDGGAHWTLVASPPAQRTFSVPRRYVKDSPVTGFGAIGAMAKQGRYYYGHINQINAGVNASDTGSTGTCAWRTDDLNDPAAFRGWDGSGWNTTWIDPYDTRAAQAQMPGSDDDGGGGGDDHTCLPIDTGTPRNGHASVRTFAGRGWRPAGWPSHLMLGWPEGTRNRVGYAFPAWAAGSDDAPFTQWGAAQYLDIDDWIPPELKGCGTLMYPSLLDADSPFSLALPDDDDGDGVVAGNVSRAAADGDAKAAAGLSYGLLGNRSAFLYFIVGRHAIWRLPVAFLPAGAPEPASGPYPPTPGPPALNPTNCSALKVSGAGRSDVNGVYTKKVGNNGNGGSGGGKTSSPSMVFPVYQKDSEHQLYHFQTHWALGWMGHASYYQVDASSKSAAVPVEWTGCGGGQPTVTCVQEPTSPVAAAPFVVDTHDNRQLVFLNGTPADRLGASCLDGSPYAFWIWPGNSSEWSLFFNGGGWCLNEHDCATRANTAYGSSLGYNISGAWAPPAGGKVPGVPSGQHQTPAYTCRGLDSNCTRVYFPYCDGSCYSSSRDEPWPVPPSAPTFTGSASAPPAPPLHFKGRGNLERTIAVLADRFGFADARRVVVQGGSAGGLSTYLHVDGIADRLRDLNPDPSTATLKVVGRPVAGFFIDPTPFAPPPEGNFSTQIRYGMNMFNGTDALSPACRAAQAPGEEWRCWMAATAFPFVKSPIFAVQSRFDEFQLQSFVHLPCILAEPFAPPYVRPSTCTGAEVDAINSFGKDLFGQFSRTVLASASTGAWLVSCIQHNVDALIDNITEVDAFSSWMVGGDLGENLGYKWVDTCGHGGDTPCNTGTYCAPS
jgi:hypothetical protein